MDASPDPLDVVDDPQAASTSVPIARKAVRARVEDVLRRVMRKA